jgi:hypothetical protein
LRAPLLNITEEEAKGLRQALAPTLQSAP